MPQATEGMPTTGKRLEFAHRTPEELLRHRVFAAGFAAATAVVIVSGTAVAIGPATWQRPPEPPTTTSPTTSAAASNDPGASTNQAATLGDPTTGAIATPLPTTPYILVVQTLPVPTPTSSPTPKPTPRPTPVADTVANARAYARSRLDAEQFSCVDALWAAESDWSTWATNPTTGAYGIPQAMPASKMASAGANWRTSPKTQVIWGLQYIATRYGSPCQAWQFHGANGWY